MAKNTIWEKGDPAWNEWQKNFITVVGKYMANGNKVFPHIPSEEFEELKDDGQVPYEAAYAAYLDSPTKANAKARKEAREPYTRLLQIFIGRHMYYEKYVTDAHRLEAGLPLRDKIKTIRTPSGEYVTIVFEHSGEGRIAGHFRIRGADSRGRPEGSNGAVFKYHVGPKPAASIADLDREWLATNTPFIFEFTDAEKGQHLSVSACWQFKGLKGPWCDIVTTIIV